MEMRLKQFYRTKEAFHMKIVGVTACPTGIAHTGKLPIQPESRHCRFVSLLPQWMHCPFLPPPMLRSEESLKNVSKELFSLNGNLCLHVNRRDEFTFFSFLSSK